MELLKLLEKIDFRVRNGRLELEINHLVHDWKKVSKGDLFVCIRGVHVNGHDFVLEVVKKGACAIVVEEELKEEVWRELPKELCVIQVEHSRKALALLSAKYFDNPAEKLITIGVTGTKGKTTTAYMIWSILTAAGVKTGLMGTIETVIGDERIPAGNTTPESYVVQESFDRMVKAGCKAVVMEVSSQGLMLHRVEGILFDYGVFTNLSKDHIGVNEHKDFNEYKYWKSVLFQHCKTGIFNADDPYAKEMMAGAKCKIETYGIRGEEELPEFLEIQTEEEKSKLSRIQAEEAMSKLPRILTEEAMAKLSRIQTEEEKSKLPRILTEEAMAKLSRIQTEEEKSKLPRIQTEEAKSELSRIQAEKEISEFQRIPKKLTASNIRLIKEQGVLGVSYDLSGELCMPVELHIPGRFSVYNSLAALCVCLSFTRDEKLIKKALQEVRVKGRGEILSVSSEFTVMIDYAHNAMSLFHLLSSLKEYQPERLITLFGCGGNRDRNRRSEMGEVSGTLSDFTIITSDNPRFEEPEAIMKDILVGVKKSGGNYLMIPDRKDAIQYALEQARKGDVVVLAGKGHEDYQEIKGVKYKLDERDIVSELSKSRGENEEK